MDHSNTTSIIESFDSIKWSFEALSSETLKLWSFWHTELYRSFSSSQDWPIEAFDKQMIDAFDKQRIEAFDKLAIFR